jgi:hypothetical protein
VPACAQSNLPFNILVDTSPVAEFNSAAFSAYGIDKVVHAKLKLIVATAKAAILERIACQCRARRKCPGTQ